MKFLYLALIGALFGACYTPTEDPILEEKFATTEQALATCRADCSPPTYNGIPVTCSSDTHCMSDAGAVYCLNGSTWSTTYCQQPFCGDGACNGTETWQTCWECAPPPTYYCGDGTCDMSNGEGGWNCPQDCCPRGIPCNVVEP